MSNGSSGRTSPRFPTSSRYKAARSPRLGRYRKPMCWARTSLGRTFGLGSRRDLSIERRLRGNNGFVIDAWPWSDLKHRTTSVSAFGGDGHVLYLGATLG